jgi:hypothetical protein
MERTQQVLEIKGACEPELMAKEIASRWHVWKTDRAQWEKEKRELRDYIFATDTTKTTNKTLPWKNSTTTPKITQIRDNLHANYMSALFPNRDWFEWIPGNQDATKIEKAKAIKSYMQNKLDRSGFYKTISQLLYDYIDYGNAFAEATYINQNHDNPVTGAFAVYHGPMINRVSPMDLVFDITATNFRNTPKITRALVSMGTLVKEGQANAAYTWAPKALEMATKFRLDMANFQVEDINKHSGIQVDGFGSFNNYLNSGIIEFLEFEGDIYDPMTKTMLIGHRVIVMDRKHVVHCEPFQSWLGTSSKEHVAWRLRPDNLLGMGPLDNLVGMQYRIDHLENLKADVFDQIAHPVIYKQGYVEDFTWGPGEQINGDAESQVNILRPDTTALNADFQIQSLMAIMEEMAGAPKQAMGIRTPGEKTAFEVGELSNAAGRIFQVKVAWFEEQIVEPLLNQMLELSRRNLEVTDVISVIDDDFGVVEFKSITQEDIQTQGTLTPVGAKHFARQNQLAQNLMGFINSAAYADEMVKAHVSSIKLAKTIESLLDIEEFGLVIPNVRIAEQLELQQQQTSAQEIQVDELAAANEAATAEQEQLDAAGTQA